MVKIICSGALIYAMSTKRFLFVHRASERYTGTWGLVGGKNEPAETPWQGLQREIQEEIGSVTIIKTVPLETFVSTNEFFLFHTYFCIVPEEFVPVLNHEHSGYAWSQYKQWPNPLHPGLQSTLTRRINTEKIKTVMDVLDLVQVVDNRLKFT